MTSLLSSMNKKSRELVPMKENSFKKVLLLHTGGTFGMTLGNGTSPVISLNPAQCNFMKQDNFLGGLISQVPELQGLAQLEAQVLCNLDSSDIDCTVWTRIAETILANWHRFDGFVIIHGTDTLAYSAAALSFFFKDLTKSIVLTGSQRPLSALRTDARANIIDAVELATSGIPEVMVCFDNRVHRGTRVTKHSNEHMQAFKSINTGQIGTFGVHFRVNKKLARKKFPLHMRNIPVLDCRISNRIFVMNTIPSTLIPATLIDPLLDSIEGLVLRGFGTGNLPLADGRYENLCKKAAQRKIPVVIASQCQAGSVNLTAYSNGRVFENQQAISALDMTIESVTVKLMVMLGRKIPFENRHLFFATPLAQECHA